MEPLAGAYPPNRRGTSVCPVVWLMVSASPRPEYLVKIAGGRSVEQDCGAAWLSNGLASFAEKA
jgi:hypothetical protein